MNPYLQFTSDFEKIMRQGKSLPLGGLPNLPPPDLPENAPRALIFAPHPDDEVIIGGLALRLMREAKMRVINVAVTQGSNPERKKPRLEELKGACDYIGFELLQVGENGLDGINLKNRTENPKNWQNSVDQIAEILAAQKPEVIFFPHDDDFNTTHIGVHQLIVDALKQLGNITCWTIETEFWGEMKGPNLIIESTKEDVADLLAALSFHIGEVQRNPYHLRMPGWMMDNVRRGGEVVGGQGGAVPDFLFATLYRLRRWKNNQFENVLETGRILPASENPQALFE